MKKTGLYFFCFLVLASYLPLPRSLMGMAYKASFLASVSVMYLLSIHFAYKGTFRSFRGGIEKVIFFAFPAAYSFYGLAIGNDAYSVVKELIFFSYPLLAMFVIINLDQDREKLYRAIIVMGLAFAVLQLLVSAYALSTGALAIENRYRYRNEFLLISTNFVLPAYVVYLGRGSLLAALRPGGLILLAAALLTLGRNEVVFIAFVIAGALFLSFIKVVTRRKALFYYIMPFAMLLAPPLYILMQFLSPAVDDTSTMWRFVEIASYAEEASRYDLSRLVFGNGFGSFLKTLIPLEIYGGEVFEAVDRVHNFWLYLLFKTGIAGTAFLLVCLFWFLIKNAGRREGRFSFLLFMYVLYYFFVKGNVFGLFTMELDISFGILLYLLVVQHDEKGETHQDALAAAK